MQHKYAAVRLLYNRVPTYHFHKEDITQELYVIRNILHNNSFPISVCNSALKKWTMESIFTESKHKWDTFTYDGKETMYITNLFKHTD